MKDLIDALITELRVDERQAAGGAAVILKAARDKLGAKTRAQAAMRARALGQLE